MAIGSVSSSKSWFTIGGKALGVQLGQKSATALFSGGSATSLFSTAAAGAIGSISVGANDAILKGMQDEIDRLQGFRTDLTVAEKQQLSEYQGKISDIEKEAQSRALTDDEISERADLYARAYKILGKDYTDVSDDSFVQTKLTAIDDLLATKPTGADADRLERLENIKATLTDQANTAAAGNGATDTVSSQLITVNGQIYDLTRPRDFTDLSQDEIKQYDELATAINDHLGYEYQLPADKRLKIAHIQQTMDTLQSSGGGTTSAALDILA